ncbi:unnamed protein product [Soboliphyme baturini]|uniref:Transmembrane protein n=1 Tax=Soboliphyme baturini TaxID=241478 RepID=A0A183IXJ0_9BILA|nr:unnamed protein product [Soboliphyme baturini]
MDRVSGGVVNALPTDDDDDVFANDDQIVPDMKFFLSAVILAVMAVVQAVDATPTGLFFDSWFVFDLRRTVARRPSPPRSLHRHSHTYITGTRPSALLFIALV